jgi:CheY-like chemotaxis protein
MGYRVVPCCDGREAVDYFRDHAREIDLAIVDMVMPVMGGYDCVNELKKIDPAIRIIIATGYSLTTDTQKLVTDGIAGFLEKPFQETELSEAVRTALGA